MPSGVSQGSAPPAGSAGAACFKAAFAKSGMRLMLPNHSTGDPRWSPLSIMVRMLIAGDAVKLFGPVVLQRGLARQVGDPHHPAEPGFGAEFLDRDPPGRP